MSKNTCDRKCGARATEWWYSFVRLLRLSLCLCFIFPADDVTVILGESAKSSSGQDTSEDWSETNDTEYSVDDVSAELQNTTAVQTDPTSVGNESQQHKPNTGKTSADNKESTIPSCNMFGVGMLFECFDF